MTGCERGDRIGADVLPPHGGGQNDHPDAAPDSQTDPIEKQS
jgi:hypothetical protein